MRLFRTLMAASLLLAALPLAGSAGADACTPTADPATLTGASVGATYLGGTYYVRAYPAGNALYGELWKETNGLAGLQTTAGQACGGAKDQLVQSVCLSRCAIPA